MLKEHPTKSYDQKGEHNHIISEQELIERIKESCSESFKVVFLKYYEMLYRYIWRHVYDSELARDLVQEVFIRVWNKRHLLNKNKSFKAYLYQISNNLVIDMIRKRKTKDKMLKINQTLNYYESEDQYYNSIDIQNAIDSLPENLRIIVILSRFEGLNYTEIAEIYNVSFQTVAYRLNKALGLMKKYLSSK